MAAAQQLLSKTVDALDSIDPDKLCGITISLQFHGDKEEDMDPDEMGMEHPEPDEDQKGGPSDADADNKKESK